VGASLQKLYDLSAWDMLELIESEFVVFVASSLHWLTYLTRRGPKDENEWVGLLWPF
jgi:hypothetical protein